MPPAKRLLATLIANDIAEVRIAFAINPSGIFHDKLGIFGDADGRASRRLVELIEDDLPAKNKVSRIWADTKGQATNRDYALVLAHEAGCPPGSPAAVDWDEPYKDSGFDAAHGRLREMQFASRISLSVASNDLESYHGVPMTKSGRRWASDESDPNRSERILGKRHGIPSQT
jgi:hypothetical protein